MRLTLSGLFFFIISAHAGFASPLLTRERLLNSLDLPEQTHLVNEINAMGADDHKTSVALVVREMKAELASGKEYNYGRILMGLLPRIADDATLIASVGPYLNSAELKVREDALFYISQGDGSLVGALLAKRIHVVFRSLPDPSAPIHEADPNDAHVEDLGVTFLRCLEGLLRSKSKDYRRLGENYLERFKKRCEVSPQGRESLKEFTEAIAREVPARR